MSATTNTTTVQAVVHQNLPGDDTEFNLADHNKKLEKLHEALVDTSMVLAISLGIIGALMFLTVASSNMRAHSPAWYLYHVTGMSVFTGLATHSYVNSDMYFQSVGGCIFFMYTSEFFLLALGFNILLLNAEIYFTKVILMEKLQWSPFFRFVVSMLILWIVVLLTAIYVVINNNSALNNKRSYHCFYMSEEADRLLIMVVRSIVPAVLCFLCTLVFIGTHCLKRSRFTMSSVSGDMREVRASTNPGELEWTLVAVYENIVFIVRTVLMLVLTYGIAPTWPVPDLHTYAGWLVLIVIHITTMYTLPLGLLFVADARAALKGMLFKALGLVSCGKLRLGEDLEQLTVSYRQDAAPEVRYGPE